MARHPAVPLASVLQRFSALRDPKDRLEALLHFYEATAQFGCAVLLSILWADPDLLAVARPDDCARRWPSG